MPYQVTRRGSVWTVVTKGTGKVHGHHKSRAKAKRQVSALYANTKDEAMKP